MEYIKGVIKMRKFKITVNGQAYDVCVEEIKESDKKEADNGKNDNAKEENFAKNDK